MDENNVQYYHIEEKKKKKPRKGLIIFVIVLVIVLLLGILGFCVGDDAENAADMDGENIAVLHIEGTIQADSGDSFSESTYNHSWVLEQIDTLIENPDNEGLILFIDSPGGSVYETDEVYLKLLEYKKTGRPLYSAMGSMATSGGYYLSAPADKIIANRNCWTGSIGVTLGTMYDISGLLDKYGIKTETITSGDNKAMGSSVEPMTAEQREIFQSLVDESYDQFVGIVADGRHMSEEKVRKLADGRIYTAKQAVDNGLVDEIGTLEDAISDMKENYDLQDCETNELQYESDDFFSSLFAKLSAASSTEKTDLAALLELMQSQNKIPIVYMAEIQK